MLRSLVLAAFLGAASMGLAAENSATPEKPADPAVNSKLTPTHKQVTSIKPAHQGQSVHLHTYCLAPSGDIVACVSPAETGEAAKASAAGWIQVYGADGVLKAGHPLEFLATAVNLSSNGEFFAAGAGKVAKLASDGKVLAVKQTPNIENFDEFKKQAAEDARKQQEEYAQQFSSMLKQTDERLATLEKTPEDERDERAKAQIQVLTSQKKSYEQQAEMMKTQASQFFSVDSVLASKLRVTALAVTDQDVFLCCGALKGRGYDVWRTDHAFENAQRVLTGLSGCCGQMDVQASNDKLVVAENTRFRVGIYDRDGKPLSHFGSRDRTAEEGFGSCCNPMNVRCCNGGDVLAAESSIGNIKRFDAEGKLVQLVGKAKIGAGCKHVAVAWDSGRDRYYMMNVDKGTICSLWPLSEAPEVTPDELAAKQAREGLGAKLTGSWVRAGYEPKKPRPPKNPIASLLGALSGSAEDQDDRMAAFSSNTPFDRVTFNQNGSQSVEGGRLTAYGADWKWECVGQEGQTLHVSEAMQGMEYLGLQVDFVSDDEVKIGISYGDTSLPATIYRRETIASPSDKPAATSSEQPAPSAPSTPVTATP